MLPYSPLSFFIHELEEGNRSAISRETLLVTPYGNPQLEPLMPSEFQTALPLPSMPSGFLAKKLPLPQNSKMSPLVWYGYFLESSIRENNEPCTGQL